MSPLFGQQHRELAQQLIDWCKQGPPVGFLEGFPGVGKSNAILPEVRQRISQQGIAVAAINSPDPGRNQLDDFLLDLAQELSLAGIDTLVQAIDEGQGQQALLLRLQQALQQPILIVVDEAQSLLDLKTGEPCSPFRSLLDRMGRHAEWPGRLLLLTNRMARRGRWSDPHAFFTLRPFAPEEGVAFLDHLLTASSREAEIPPERRRDVVAWVGGNPRALKLIVAALASAPLAELIGIEPDLWELRDREVSRSLLENLERELLRKVIEQLDPVTKDAWLLASVYRKPVRREAWDAMPAGPKAGESARRELVDRFLLEHQQGWFHLNPVAREVARAELSNAGELRRRAHSLAGEHYARHFRARELTGGGRLGGHFVEARYHLVQAGRGNELSGIADRYLAHLRVEITPVSPVPTNPRELDERIAVLAAALQEGGPKSLEVHLARCFERRGRGNDRHRALEHARRAVGAQAPAEAWHLLLRLEGELKGTKAAVQVLREAERFVSPSQNLYSLYQVTGEILARQDKLDEAVALLKQGMERIPPTQSLGSLYQAAGEILARQDKFDEAVALLKQGIERVPPTQNLFSLYQAAGEILARQDKLDEAVALLKQGMERIPPTQSLGSLYQAAGEILARQDKLDEAVALLKQGMERIPPTQSLGSLYQAAGEILARQDKLDEAVALLKQGIEKVPPTQNLFSLYQAAGEILARQDKFDEAVALLKQGIERVPPTQNLFSLYQAAGEILARQDKLDEAVALLKQGMERIPPTQSLGSLYQAAGEILARQDKLDEAVALLKQGMERIPTQSLSSLYQAAGAALARQGQIEPAIDVLCEGIQKVPAHAGRYKISESGLLLAAAARRRDLLERVTALCAKPQSSLGAALSKLLDDSCREAADLLSEERRRFPRYLTIAMLEALSHLGAADPDAARTIFLGLPLDIVREKGGANIWLETFVALRCGETEEARRLFALFRGAPLEDSAPPSERELLAEWNRPISFMEPHSSYYLPVLPAALTGLPRPITRWPPGEPVAELAAHLAEPTSEALPGSGGIASPAGEGGAFLFVATEWSSHHGGLSTLNREVCRALAASGQHVVCWVPKATPEEIQAAEAVGVRLLPASPLPGGDVLATLGRRPRLPAGFEPDFVIGHGRITGPAAKVLVDSFFPHAGRLHFIHMAPGEIEWFKRGEKAAERSESREKQELDLAMGARLVVAIGPRLAREVGNLLSSRPDAPPLHQLDPGLAPGGLREPPPGIQILLLGRTEDLELKGIDIAAAAISRLPASLFESEPILAIRGAPHGTGDALRSDLLTLAPLPGDRLRVREYTIDTDDLLGDLRRSSLLLLPSRSEGFGLVALEALALGTPILVSDRSGIGELLRKHLEPHEVSRWIVSTTGDRERDAGEWSRAIEFSLRDRQASFQRTHELRTRVAAELDWKQAIQGLLAVLQVRR